MRLAVITLTFGLSACASQDAQLRPFRTDGCSLFPDRGISRCCIEHDLTYWQGGTPDQRKAADRKLRHCVSEAGGGAVRACLVYTGVRFGGHPLLPTWFRWGYGWPYARGYGELTADDLEQVRERLQDARTVNGADCTAGDQRACVVRQVLDTDGDITADGPDAVSPD